MELITWTRFLSLVLLIQLAKCAPLESEPQVKQDTKDKARQEETQSNSNTIANQNINKVGNLLAGLSQGSLETVFKGALNFIPDGIRQGVTAIVGNSIGVPNLSIEHNDRGFIKNATPRSTTYKYIDGPVIYTNPPTSARTSTTEKSTTEAAEKDGDESEEEKEKEEVVTEPAQKSTEKTSEVEKEDEDKSEEEGNDLEEVEEAAGDHENETDDIEPFEQYK